MTRGLTPMTSPGPGSCTCVVIGGPASGQLAGAGLDVMAQEPSPPKHPLFELVNVVLTPHTAGPTGAKWAMACREGFGHIRRVAAGSTRG